jgi:hypothetical protein
LHIGTDDRFGWGLMNDDYFDRHFKVLRDWEKNWLSRPSAVWLQVQMRVLRSNLRLPAASEFRTFAPCHAVNWYVREQCYIDRHQAAGRPGK